MKFSITHHAVERYIDRCDRALSFHQAKALLEKESESAVSLKTKTKNGQQQWQVSSLNCIFVSKFDNKETIVVTILKDNRFIELNDSLEPEQLEFLDDIHSRAVRENSSDWDVLEDLQATSKAINDFVSESAANHKAYKLAKVKNKALAENIKELAEIVPKSLNKEIEKKIEAKLYEAEEQQRKTRNALRFAIRALYGEISAAQALEAVAMLDLSFIDDDFYKAGKTLREIADENCAPI